MEILYGGNGSLIRQNKMPMFSKIEIKYEPDPIKCLTSRALLALSMRQSEGDSNKRNRMVPY